MNMTSHTFSLNGAYLLPSPGIPIKKCVIFLHGLGANGENLIDLAHLWAPHLQNTAFLSPNAPFPYETSDFLSSTGFQWFDLKSQDPKLLENGIQIAFPYLSTYIDEIIEFFSLSSQDLALVGFSQGAMMALAMGLWRRPSLGGIVSYSGGIFSYKPLPPTKPPPLCLVHGTQDMVVLPETFFKSISFLEKNDIPTESHLLDGLSHTIDDRAAKIGENFLRKYLYVKEV